jgi:hypothetical protein
MRKRWNLLVAKSFSGVLIAALVFLLPAVTPVAQAAEMWEGIWAQTKEECLDKDGPNSRTFIDLSNKDHGRRRPIIDQYEHHCQIDRIRGNASRIVLDNTCFEFWEQFEAKKSGSRETTQISARDWLSISINGKQYVRCAE